MSRATLYERPKNERSVARQIFEARDEKTWKAGKSNSEFVIHTCMMSPETLLFCSEIACGQRGGHQSEETGQDY